MFTRSAGGIVDLFVFAGPTPSEVTRQYHSVIGLPAIPPYWALGFHQCRWGYKELSDVRKIVDGFEGAHIPLDTVRAAMLLAMVLRAVDKSPAWCACAGVDGH